MKGIYLTEEAKKAIEDKIAELEAKRDDAAEDNDVLYVNSCIVQIFAYYEIVSSATILPTQRTWESLEEDLFKDVHPDTDRTQMMYVVYPNGVIITDKKP